MIKMVKEDGPHGCPLVMLGLSHGNLERLKGGNPIMLDVDQCAMLGMGQRELLIYAGPDEVSMMAEVESHGLIPEGSTDELRAKFDAYGEAKRRGESPEPPSVAR
jgi:hypothetical protein